MIEGNIFTFSLSRPVISNNKECNWAHLSGFDGILSETFKELEGLYMTKIFSGGIVPISGLARNWFGNSYKGSIRPSAFLNISLRSVYALSASVFALN